MQDLTGQKNPYQCDECGLVIITIHKDSGVTPMFMACRATNGCKGSMHSCMYECPQMATPTHEWYKPSDQELKTLSKGMKQHVEQGGVLLRKIVPFKSIMAALVAPKG